MRDLQILPNVAVVTTCFDGHHRLSSSDRFRAAFETLEELADVSVGQRDEDEAGATAAPSKAGGHRQQCSGTRL